MNDPTTSPDHPVWPLLRLLILMVSLYLILRQTASNFDVTEIITICGMFLAAAGGEALPPLLRVASPHLKKFFRALGRTMTDD